MAPSGGEVLAEERAAPERSGAARPAYLPEETPLGHAERRRAGLLALPITFAILAVCLGLGLVIRSAVFAA